MINGGEIIARILSRFSNIEVRVGNAKEAAGSRFSQVYRVTMLIQ
jgi:hypothetical protein